MKKFIIFLFGCATGYYTPNVVDYFQNPPAPTPEAQVIIDSMENGNGWYLGKKSVFIDDETNIVVNYEANTIIHHAILPGWTRIANLSNIDRQFGFWDRYHVGKHYDYLRRRLEIEKFKPVDNTK